MNVLQQVRTAFKRKNRLAVAFGLAFGGIVPVAIYVVTHGELHGTWASSSGAIGAAGLLYSAQTVFQWARAAFANAIKAFGFCALLEGVMVTSTTRWLALTCLGYLVVINAIATACTVANQPRGPTSAGRGDGRRRLP